MKGKGREMTAFRFVSILLIERWKKTFKQNGKLSGKVFERNKVDVTSLDKEAR